MAAAAAACARRALVSSSSLRSFSPGAATKMAGFSSATPSSSRFSRHRLPFISRLPVELGCAQSLMPLHSVTASTLLTSKLSLKSGSWAWLSEVASRIPVVDLLNITKGIFRLQEVLQRRYNRAYKLD